MAAEKKNASTTIWFDLQEMCEMAQRPIGAPAHEIEGYLAYITSVVQLYANMCKERNTKSLKKVKDKVGISMEHIVSVLSDQSIVHNVKCSYFALYEVLFLDVEPFLPLARSEKRNFSWENITTKNLSEKTLIIFQQISESTEISKQIQEFENNMLPTLLNFWDKGPADQPGLNSGQAQQQLGNGGAGNGGVGSGVGGVVVGGGGGGVSGKQIPQMRSSVKKSGSVVSPNMCSSNNFVWGPSSDSGTTEKNVLRQQLRLFFAVLHLTKTSIDLGFFKTETIEHCLMQILQVFSCFVWQEVEMLLQSDSWIKKFFYKVRQNNHNGEFNEELENIVIEISSLIQLYMKIKLNCQIIQLLRAFYMDYNVFSEKKKISRLAMDSKALFSLLFMNTGSKKDKTASGNGKDIEINLGNGENGNGSRQVMPSIALFANQQQQQKKAVGQQQSGSGKFQFRQKFHDDEGAGLFNANQLQLQEKIRSKFEISIQSILLNFLLSKGLGQSPARQYVLETFIAMQQHVYNFCRQLEKIELNCGQSEIVLQEQLEGNSNTWQIISPFRLDMQIQQIFFFDEEEEKKTIKEKMLEVSNNIIKFNSKFKDNQLDLRLFHKTQNIMRNLGVHKSILRLLSLQSQDKSVHDTVDSAISFLINFCKNNRINSEELLFYRGSLLALMKSSASAPKLIGIMLRHQIYKEEGLTYIDEVIQILQQSTQAAINSGSSNSQQQQQQQQSITSQMTMINLSEADKVAQKHALQLLFSFLCKSDQLDHQDSLSYQLHKMPCRQPGSLVLHNQQNILSKLLKITQLLSILYDHKHIEECLKHQGSPQQQQQQQYQSFNDLPVDVQVYKLLVSLLGKLVSSYPLGVVTCQKILLAEEIKQLLQRPQTPFVVKKDNLRALYQVHICLYEKEKINVGCQVSELNELLVTVVLPDLAQFYQHIHGLVKRSQRILQNEEKLTEFQALRGAIARFWTTLVMAGESRAEDQQQAQGASVLNARGGGTSKPGNSLLSDPNALIHHSPSLTNRADIFNDPDEYWDYLYGGNFWNYTKDGLLVFLLDCYQEIQKRDWLQQDLYLGDRQTISQESEQLIELLMVLRQLLEVMRNVLQEIEINCFSQQQQQQQPQIVGSGINISAQASTVIISSAPARNTHRQHLIRYIQILDQCLILHPLNKVQGKGVKGAQLKLMKELQIQKMDSMINAWQEKQQQQREQLESGREEKQIQFLQGLQEGGGGAFDNCKIPYWRSLPFKKGSTEYRSAVVNHFFEQIREMILNKYMQMEEVFQAFNMVPEHFAEDSEGIIPTAVVYENAQQQISHQQQQQQQQPQLIGSDLTKEEFLMAINLLLMKSFGGITRQAVQLSNGKSLLFDYEEVKEFFYAIAGAHQDLQQQQQHDKAGLAITQQLQAPAQIQASGMSNNNSVAQVNTLNQQGLSNIGGGQGPSGVGVGQLGNKKKEYLVVSKKYFMRKLIQYIESKKNINDAEKLKKDNQVEELNEEALALQKQAALQSYLHSFQDICIQVESSKSRKKLARCIITQLLERGDYESGDAQRAYLQSFFENILLLFQDARHAGHSLDTLILFKNILKELNAFQRRGVSNGAKNNTTNSSTNSKGDVTFGLAIGSSGGGSSGGIIGGSHNTGSSSALVSSFSGSGDMSGYQSRGAGGVNGSASGQGGSYGGGLGGSRADSHPFKGHHQQISAARTVQNQYKMQSYRIVQSIIQNSKIYLTFLNKLSSATSMSCSDSNTSQQQSQLEQALLALSILNQIYRLNIKTSHTQVLGILRSSLNIELVKGLFMFITDSFRNYTKSLEKLSSQLTAQAKGNIGTLANQGGTYFNGQNGLATTSRKKSALKSASNSVVKKRLQQLQHLDEAIVRKLLKFISYSCEDSNDQMQLLFREQQFAHSQSYVSTNALDHIAFFLIEITKYRKTIFQQQQYQQSTSSPNHPSLRYFNLVNQSLTALIHLTNGQQMENKMLLIENRAFLTVLNAIITESLDVQSDSFRDIQALQSVISGVKLLLIITVGMHDQDNLTRIISIINIEKLTQVANFIFHQRIKYRLIYILQERQCVHRQNVNCTQ